MEVRRIEPVLPKKNDEAGDSTVQDAKFHRFETGLQCHLVLEVVAVGGRHFQSITSRQEV